MIATIFVFGFPLRVFICLLVAAAVLAFAAILLFAPTEPRPGAYEDSSDDIPHHPTPTRS